VDNAGENDLVPVLQARVPGRSHGAIVFGKTGFAGRIYRDETRLPEDISELRQIGRTINREVATESGRLSLSEFATFDRNVRAFGRQGQRQLSALRVGIVGLGGTGSIVAEQLAHLGVGEFVLIDPDEVEATNLNRLVGATFQDVGAAKVHVLARYMKSLRSTELEVDAVQADVLREHAQTKLLSCDFVFCCTDTHGSRAALVQLAYQYLIPMIDMGVRIDAEDGVITAMAGRTQMLAPGLPCLQCQHLLDPEAVRRDFMTEEARRADPYITSGNEAQPSVISLNGTVASLSITMFLAAMVGVPSRARDLVYRIMEGIVKPATSSASPHCVVCSRSGALAKGDSWPLLTK
jgi:molybdopterin/thiamine biosynthesis adenylyltransferase